MTSRPQLDEEQAVTDMESLLEILTRRGVVTTDPARRDECCGQPRDEDGFCTYREGHPIYVDPEEASCADRPNVAAAKWVADELRYVARRLFADTDDERYRWLMERVAFWTPPS